MCWMCRRDLRSAVRGAGERCSCTHPFHHRLLRVCSSMASLRREVLGGYRRLMRVRVVAFKDDSTMLKASKVQLRKEFNKNKAITDPSKIGQQHTVAEREGEGERPSVCAG